MPVEKQKACQTGKGLPCRGDRGGVAFCASELRLEFVAGLYVIWEYSSVLAR